MTVLAFVCKTKLTFNNISGESLSRDGIAEHLFQLSDVWGFKCSFRLLKESSFIYGAPAAFLGSLLAAFLGFAASENTG